MIIALLIGKHKSTGVKGKNYMKILGRPLVEYPLLAAKNSKLVEKIYVSTDSPYIKKIANKYEAYIIDRPEYLSRPNSPTEDVFEHAYRVIKQVEKNIKYIFILFANSADILPKYWEEAVNILEKDSTLDSVVSISKYNMFSPLRARKVCPDGTTSPFLDLNSLNISNTFDRDALGDIYFIDFGVQVVKPKCLEEIAEGVLPFKWLGKRQGYIIKDFGFDIDVEWQIPVIKYWLKKNNFTYNKTPYEK